MMRNMPHKRQNFNRHKALTLLEMVIALSIVSVLFAVVLPVFTIAGKSWDSRQSASEAIQNGRVLVDYINSSLMKSVKIVSVSDPTETSGFIEFEDAASTTLRFDIAASNYVQFGEIGSLSELAGPVTKLQFTCYALDDLTTPITDAEKIRFIKIEAVLDNASAYGNDKTFKTSAFLVVNGSFEEELISTPPIGWWKFDDASGTTAVDSSGNGNDGTLNGNDHGHGHGNGNGGTDQWITGAVGGALDFDGRNDYINCGNDQSLGITGTQITVAAWVRWDSNDAWSAIAMRTSSGNWDDGYGLYAHSDGTVNFYVTKYNRNRAVKAFSADGQWHHIVGTYDGSSVRIWVDGVEGTPDSYSGDISNANDDFEIARGTSNRYNFNGAIDDVCIYDHVLTTGEITELAGGGRI